MDRLLEKELEDLEAMRGKGIKLSPIRTCYYCGHTGPDVNHFTRDIYIGGCGIMHYPCCDDARSCIGRVEAGQRSIA